jgi:ribosome maturation factor RimP
MANFDTIKTIVESLIDDTDAFIVDSKVTPGNNFKFFIDADSGFDLKRCVSVTRQLRKQIEEKELYPEGNFTLEVSSPGIDEPLKFLRQYHKNIGRLLEITFNDIEQKPIVGRLKGVEEEAINIELTDKKKKISTEQNIEFQQIKKAIIQIEF